MKMTSKFTFVLLLATLLIVAVGISAWSRPIPATSAAGLTQPDQIINLEDGLNGLTLQQVPGVTIIPGTNYTLRDGETVHQNLLVLGGNANLLPESTVVGDIFVMGGTVNAAGTIDGNVVLFGGTLTLTENALVTGDVSSIGGSIRGNESAVQGTISNENSFYLPSTGLDFNIPNLRWNYNPAWNVLWYLFRAFMWAVVAILVAVFLSRPTQRVINTVVQEPVASGGIGCLTLLVYLILIPIIILLLITICLSPIPILATIILYLAWAYGLIAIGTETGLRIGKFFKSDWPLPLAAGVGTFLLFLVLNGVGIIVPCIGWVLPFLVGLAGLGAVLMTRFGSRNYPDRPAAPPPASDQVIPAELSEPQAGEAEIAEAAQVQEPPTVEESESSQAGSEEQVSLAEPEDTSPPQAPAEPEG